MVKIAKNAPAIFPRFHKPKLLTHMALQELIAEGHLLVLAGFDRSLVVKLVSAKSTQR